MKRDGNERGSKNKIHFRGLSRQENIHLMNVNLNKSSDVRSLLPRCEARKGGGETIYLINVVEGTIKSRRTRGA